MKPQLQEYIDEFNNGEIEDLLGIFGSMEQILTFFHKQKILPSIDPFDDELSDYQLEILDFIFNRFNDKEMMRYTISQLSDVEIKEDGYYLKLRDKSDLSDLFRSYGSRDIGPKEIVKAIFDEDMWESFSDTTDNIYQDVIEVLTPQNIGFLKTYLLQALSNVAVNVEDDSPDLFRDNADNNGSFQLTPDNVDDIIGDEESLMYLIDNDYLPDFLGDLYNVHRNAYNTAYEMEMYDLVMNELSTFFDVKESKWVSEPNNVGKLTEYYYIKFNPNEVVNSIKKYVGDRNIWGNYQHNIDYIGSWLGLMESSMDNGVENWLDFRVSDYVDFNLVNKYINEIFPDYI